MRGSEGEVPWVIPGIDSNVIGCDRFGCISLKLFDKVVRYGAGCLNPGYEAENETPPNTPYATTTTAFE
ncbi:MAG: hypothetical protein F6K26_50985 [Moorea sp. SIO2I5]|nr:hypothetical protein [Moorena sp. SIO2I5]